MHKFTTTERTAGYISFSVTIDGYTALCELQLQQADAKRSTAVTALSSEHCAAKASICQARRQRGHVTIVTLPPSESFTDCASAVQAEHKHVAYSN